MTADSRFAGIRGRDDWADALIALGSWAVASSGIVLGVAPALTASAVLAVPMAVGAASGRRARRGGLMATIVSVLAVAMLAGGPVERPASAVALLGLIVGVALHAGRRAARLGRIGLRALHDGVAPHGRFIVEASYRGLEADAPHCV